MYFYRRSYCAPAVAEIAVRRFTGCPFCRLPFYRFGVYSVVLVIILIIVELITSLLLFCYLDDE